MKRLVTISAFFLFSPFLFANPQYTQYDCDQLAAERENIRKRLNSGYRVREGNYLNERDRKLFIEISKHCRNPVKEENYFYYSDSIRTTSSQPSPVTSRPSRRPVNTNYTANNRVFSGDKREAWDRFYKIPARCRSKDLTPDDFVFCAEDKADQRRDFEANWNVKTP